MGSFGTCYEKEREKVGVWGMRNEWDGYDNGRVARPYSLTETRFMRRVPRESPEVRTSIFSCRESKKKLLDSSVYR